MKNHYLILLLILIGNAFPAHTQVSAGDRNSSGISLDRAESVAPLDNFRTDFHFTMGTSYSSSPYFSGIQNYINPGTDISFSSDLKISTGVVLSNTMNGPAGQASSFAPSSSPSGMVYFQGNYKLSDKITISGAGYREFNQTSQIGVFHQSGEDLQNFHNNYNRLMNDQGYSLNLHYQFNDHVSFEGGIQVHQGNNYYLRSPFYQNAGFYRNSGFYSSPFPGYD